jgi:hypothetical protein
MFNPLCIFSSELLEAFVKSGQKYFVRQSFNRGLISNEKLNHAFLISHYSDFGQAYEHFEAIAQDHHRRLYRWSEPDDRNRLQLAATQPAGYTIYASVVMPGWKEKAERELKVQVRNYIARKNLWHPAKKDSVEFELYPHFGEVFVRMRFHNQEIKIRLEEVETENLR